MSTVSNLIIDALNECNIKSDLESFNSEELVDARQTLNHLMFSLPNIGKHIFRRDEGTYQFPSVVSSFILPSTYYDLDSAYISYNGYDSDLTELSVNEYRELSNKASEGKPTYYALFYKTDFTVEVKVHPKPNITGAAGYIFNYIGILNHINYTANTSNLISPPNFYLALKWALADELANKYDVPLEKQAIISQKKNEALKNANSNNVGHKKTFYIQGAF